MTEGSSSDEGADARVGTADAARDAFDHVPTPTAWLAGPDFVMTACNAAYRALTGRSDIVGRTAREVFPELGGQQAFELLDEAYRTGQVVERREWRFQYDRGDGLADVYQDFVIAPTHDVTGTVTGLLVSTTDVTARTVARLQVETEARDAHRDHSRALDVVTALQSALLPHELPLLPQVDVAARYLLASVDSAAGGDWFDAVARPGGRVALVVGDVVGHGVDASAIMGQLRAVLHERLLGDEPIADALAPLDRFARRHAQAASATVCVAELDPGTGDLTYCTAGHPPPLVVGADGEPRFLAPTGAGPLAAGTDFPHVAEHLGPGEILVLYTDGLVERPERGPAESTVEVGRVLSDAAMNRGLRVGAPARATERVCQIGLEMLTRVTGYADDITLLAAQRVDPLPDLAVRLAAVPAAAGQVRHHLADWLAPLGVRSLDEFAVQHAVTELVVNSIVHAYPDPTDDPQVEVEATLDPDGFLMCTVRDHGRWQEPVETGSHGRGLAMTAGLVDDFELTHGDAGTVAVLRHRLSRDAQLLTGRRGGVLDPRTDAGGPAEVHVDDDLVTVHGPLDHVDVGPLRPQLLAAARGGARPIDVDLTDVSHLGSAAVQLFHELVQEGIDLQLRAAAGSVAQHVLDLVALPYTTEPR